MTVIAVTGASGFLGSAVVAALARRGHEVVRVIRTIDRNDSPHEARLADLRDAHSVGGVLSGIEVLVHVAAAKKGTFHDQYPSTVKATQLVLNEALRAQVKRVILISSFAVYDYQSVRPGGTVDEQTPVDEVAHGRDAYTDAKIMQEALAVAWAHRTRTPLVVARPGVVVGPDNWWTYRLGEQFGPLWLGFGSRAQVPVSDVRNCADAIAHLADLEISGVEIYNILDSEKPTQRWLRKQLARRMRTRPVQVTIPWPVAFAFAHIATRINREVGSPLRLPGFLVPGSLAVRAKPLAYSDSKIKQSGWRQRHSLAESLTEMIGPEHL